MYILSKKEGRLCNRLFSAAHILALAIENGQTFVNVSFSDYAGHFTVTQRDLLCRYPVHKSALKGEKILGMALYGICYTCSVLLSFLPGSGFSVPWLRLSVIRSTEGDDTELLLDEAPPALLSELTGDTAHLLFFQGWNLRAYQSLIKHGDAVREYFTPTPAYQTKIQTYVKKNREGCAVLIGVVIRHGDYRTWQGGKHFYSLETYTTLMMQVRALCGSSRVNFLICSDEEQDTSVFESAQLDFSFRSGHMIENLYYLAQCDYLLSPPSTYGMWASLYGKVPLHIIDDPSEAITAMDSFKVCNG